MPIGTDLFDPSHEVRRVVDRLRVVAPRIEQPQVAAVREVVAWMAQTTAEGAGRTVPVVPQVRNHALADQIRVLADDLCREAPAQSGELSRRLAELRRLL